MHQHGDVPAPRQSSPVGVPTTRGVAVPPAPTGRPRPEAEARTSAEFDGVGVMWREVRRSGDSLKATFLGYCAEPLS